MTKTVLAISGSTRKNSSNESVLRFIATALKGTAIIKMYEGIEKLPHFNPDLDEESLLPAPVLDLRKQIEQADGLVICTPEYVFSLPGSLKNAIEWLVSTTLLSKKPTALIVASASGDRAMEALELIMNTLEANIAGSSRLVIKGAKGKIGEYGTITDETTARLLLELIQSLLESMEGTQQIGGSSG